MYCEILVFCENMLRSTMFVDDVSLSICIYIRYEMICRWGRLGAVREQLVRLFYLLCVWLKNFICVYCSSESSFMILLLSVAQHIEMVLSIWSSFILARVIDT